MRSRFALGSQKRNIKVSKSLEKIKLGCLPLFNSYCEIPLSYHPLLPYCLSILHFGRPFSFKKNKKTMRSRRSTSKTTTYLPDRLSDSELDRRERAGFILSDSDESVHFSNDQLSEHSDNEEMLKDSAEMMKSEASSSEEDVGPRKKVKSGAASKKSAHSNTLLDSDAESIAHSECSLVSVSDNEMIHVDLDVEEIDDDILNEADIAEYQKGEAYQTALASLQSLFDSTLPPITPSLPIVPSQRGKAKKTDQKKEKAPIILDDRELTRDINGIYPQKLGKFICPVKGCIKTFLVPGGLKYHVEKFEHDITLFIQATYPRNQSNVESSAVNEVVSSTAVDTTAPRDLIIQLKTLPYYSRVFTLNNKVFFPNVKLPQYLKFKYDSSDSPIKSLKPKHAKKCQNKLIMDERPNRGMISGLYFDDPTFTNLAPPLMEDFDILNAA